jgi:glycosyltransferase involved in cell wall biosynthesis
MTKISVCMATRNGEKYIKRQLESILAQLDPDDEVVISDDSSSDGTVAIIKGFSDHRVRLYENNTFFSPIYNLENALNHASGEIIVLSDQDDVWMDNKIAVIRREFSGAHSGIKLIVLDGHIVDEHETVIHDSIFARINSGKGLLKNIYDNTYMGCCMAFSRDLLKIALPFPRNIPMHDMWLGLLAELFGTVEFVPEKTIKYRRHGASVTDLRRRLDVVRQIKRRYHLVTSLLGRFLHVKYGRKTVQEKQIS